MLAKLKRIKATTQSNTEFYRNTSIIAENEALTKKYLRKLVASKQEDSTQMTKKEMARIEMAETDFSEIRYALR